MSFSVDQFKSQVSRAQTAVRRILDTTRHPQYPENIHHTYDDKYLLAQFLTNSALDASMTCLEVLGLNAEIKKTVFEWAESRSVTLLFKSEERCAFEKEDTYKVTSPSEHVTKVEGILGTTTITDKVVTTVTDYYWKFDVEYELSAYKGNNPEEKVVLLSSKGSWTLINNTKVTPKPVVSVVPPISVDITWLLHHFSEQGKSPSFSINRNVKSCRTPRRNDQIEASMEFFKNFTSWAQKTAAYFQSQLFVMQWRHTLDLSKVNTGSVFVPVIPFFERFSLSGNSGGTVLSLADMGLFLSEQKRSLAEKFSELARMYPDDNSLITLKATKAVVTCLHATEIVSQYLGGVNYIEYMLYKQLRAAIGSEVSTLDFMFYMQFHNRMLFRPEFQPRPFCFFVARPEHYPEGLVSIERNLLDGTMPEPIYSHVRRTARGLPVKLPINGSTNVIVGGERYLHGCIFQKFSGQTGLKMTLNARARQFSIFIVVIGTVGAKDLFLPKYAAIVKNRDEFEMPMEFEALPTPKEFRDAIESLSPEQQRFAKLYRGMQLSSTLFGITILQVKPQIERLLGLPYDSLTKEVRLTEDILDLFMKYNIPSDLLSAPKEIKEPEKKLLFVKESVAKFLKMISDEKEAELKKKLEAERLKRLIEEEKRRKEEEARRKREEELKRKREEEEARRRKMEEERRKKYEEIENVKTVMLSNIEKSVSRAETLDSLVMKSEELSYKSKSFQKSASPSFFSKAVNAISSIASSSNSSSMATLSNPLYSASGSSGANPLSSLSSAPSAPVSYSTPMASAPAPIIQAQAQAPPQPQAQAQAPSPQPQAQAQAPQPQAQAPAQPQPQQQAQAPAPAQPQQQAQPQAPTPAQREQAPTEQQPTEQPKDQPKDQPKEQPKDQPKDEPKEQPIEQQDSQKEIDLVEEEDVTKIPTELDKKYDQYDQDNALRPTIITVGTEWKKRTQKSLLSPLTQSTMVNKDISAEKNRTFDLMDVLSRSGSLPFQDASIHVVIAGTHSFENSVITTVIEDNVNPIESVERSTLILATTIHRQPPQNLIRDEQLQRVSQFSPALFGPESDLGAIAN